MKVNSKMISHKDTVAMNFKIIFQSHCFCNIDYLGKFFFSNGKIYEGECKGGKGNGKGNKIDLVVRKFINNYLSYFKV